MQKKRFIIAIAVVVLVLSATPVFACGPCHGGRGAVRYSVCATESCTEAGLHLHNRSYYTAHYYGDGHDYHDYCGVEDCVLDGYHAHDGTYCFGHTANDGHGHYAGGCRL